VSKKLNVRYLDLEGVIRYQNSARRSVPTPSPICGSIHITKITCCGSATQPRAAERDAMETRASPTVEVDGEHVRVRALRLFGTSFPPIDIEGGKRQL
jgi:hypothetical protein